MVDLNRPDGVDTFERIGYDMDFWAANREDLNILLDMKTATRSDVALESFARGHVLRSMWKPSRPVLRTHVSLYVVVTYLVALLKLSMPLLGCAEMLTVAHMDAT